LPCEAAYKEKFVIPTIILGAGSVGIRCLFVAKMPEAKSLFAE
jgi:hypothetical protein